MILISRFKHFLMSVFLSAIVFTVAGQGCSDAGVCTTSDMDAQAEGTLWHSRVYVLNSFGLGEKNVIINSTEVGFELNIWQGIAVRARVPFIFATGNIGQNYGFGDLTIGLSYTLGERNDWTLNFNANMKLPSGDANRSFEGKPLPMTYQNSLGTYDMILGTAWFYKTWQVAIGYQHPYNRNKNEFLHSAWPDNEDAQEYFESNQLDRGDDLMLRVQKNFKRPKSKYLVGLMPVFRLQKDKILKDDKEVELDGSQGLTLNVNVGAIYALGKHVSLNLLLGVPVVSRDVIADGLTRTFVFNVGLTYTFEDLFELR